MNPGAVAQAAQRCASAQAGGGSLAGFLLVSSNATSQMGIPKVNSKKQKV